MKTVLSLLLFLTFFSPVRADIRPHHSGAWYNQVQSGHGLSIQVLDEERTIAFWFAYTPDGSPMFLVIDGLNDGHTVTGPAYYQEGMIWRQFDPATLNSEVWGEVSIEFTGCNSAVLNWSSSMEGYGDGQVELERLAFVGGLECYEVPAEMTGEWQVGFLDFSDVPYSVTVEADGTFEFFDGLDCLWEGHIHVESKGGYLAGQFGAPTCPSAVPMLYARGFFYANGVTFCSSGGSCITYDQAMTLESVWYEGGTIGLKFLR